MVALYAVWYNFCRIHKSLRVSPAMAAGVSDRLWGMEDLAEMVEAALPKPGKRGLTGSATMLPDEDRSRWRMLRKQA